MSYESVVNINSAVILKPEIILERSASLLSPPSRNLCIRSIYSAISLLYWLSAVLHKKQT